MLKIKKNYTINHSHFCTSLKDKKKAMLKSKVIEEVFAKNQKQSHDETMAFLFNKLNVQRLIMKVGLVFILPLTGVYINFNMIYPKNSKPITDMLNTNFNFMTNGTILIVLL